MSNAATPGSSPESNPNASPAPVTAAPAGAGSASARPLTLRLAQAWLWGLSFLVLCVVPWFFGGMGPEGYVFLVWAGWAAVLPLVLWLVSCVQTRRAPPLGFVVALLCWAGLGWQVWLSAHNPSHAIHPPWMPEGADRIAYDQGRPCSAFPAATLVEGRLWLSLGLLALAGYAVGLPLRALRWLLACLVVNVVLLALIGIPFKYSGDYLMLGRWRMPENYFYSTFIYHNHWCAYALLGLAAVAGFLFEARRLWLQLLLCALAMVIFASSIIAVSRLGTLMMAGFLAVVAWVWVKRQLAAAGARGAWRALLFGTSACAVGALILLCVVFLNRHGPGSVGQRTWGYILRANPFNSRVELVEDAVPMVKEKPVFGWGLGSFGMAFRDYQRPSSIVLYNEGRETRYDHCHNDWMERLVELGCVGAVLGLAPLVFWCWRRGARTQWPPVANWLFFGCLLLGVFALGDMVFVNRCVAAAGGLLLGLLSSNLRQGSPSEG